jgi:hypothetical protein
MSDVSSRHDGHGTFKLTIRLGNDAMQTSEDVANVLIEVAADLRSGGFGRHAQSIHDYNGNRVGQHKLTDYEDVAR